MHISIAQGSSSPSAPLVRCLFACGIGLTFAACGAPHLDPVQVLESTAEVSLASIPKPLGQKEIQEICKENTVDKLTGGNVKVLDASDEALLARLAVIDAARRSIDVQYYIWDDDFTGCLIADRLFHAADRGVKVRLLLDSTQGAPDVLKSRVAASHPHLEIAHFNPMLAADGYFEGFPIPILGELDRAQSRMHNKLLIADRCWVIGGGRNLADGYFGLDDEQNLRDVDYIASGPVVSVAAASFDAYWKSKITRKIHPDPTQADEAKELRRELAQRVEKLRRKARIPFSTTAEAAQSSLASTVKGMRAVPMRFVADPPEWMLVMEKSPSPVSKVLDREMLDASDEVEMHAAYFIPQKDFLDLMDASRRRGTTVRVLTNSVASSDGLAAAEGISGRRLDILETGAELHELNVKAPVRKTYAPAWPSADLGMHTKTIVIDGRMSFVGSYNMDPRSRFINTECGVLIEDRPVAAQLKRYMGIDFALQNSWRVDRAEDGRVFWKGETADGSPVVKDRDPDVSVGRKLKTWMMRFLPWEHLL